ncbi:MAG: preprotein translocase subunit SecE [Candidatus Kapaibacteriota bacterium]|jgi:preprotein translocase subunit SecE
MIGNIKGFIGEVSAEMKKVSWPTKEQLKESTYVVIIVSLVITTIVAIMDAVVSNIMKLIF